MSPTKWSRGNRQKAQEDRLADDTDQGTGKKGLAHIIPGNKAERDVEQHIDDAGNIGGAGKYMKIFYKKSTDQLADTEHSAVVQVCRNDKEINAGGKDQHSGNCHC